MDKRIFLSSPHMSDEGYEMAYIKEAFDTNWIAPLGENVNKFEEDMASYLDAPYGVALSSGSAAIHLSLMSFGVGAGDVVFCSSLTFSGSCNAIKYLNAVPVFIDCDYETYNISAVALKKAYEKYPNPKAIIIVDLYGNPANYEEILPIIKSHGTPILEDAAEALGAKYKDEYCGTLGDIGILSFNGNKIITTSGGGMAIVNNIETKQKLTFWATQSRENFPWYQHEEVGYNYRLSNICAGIGRGQMKVLDKRVARKREIFELYKSGFAGCDQIAMSPETENAYSNRWLSVLTLSEDCKTDFMTIINKLAENNIEARPLWKPMHLQPVFADCNFFSSLDEGVSQINKEKPMSISEALFNKSLCLPSDSKMTDEEVKAVVKLVLECVR